MVFEITVGSMGATAILAFLIGPILNWNANGAHRAHSITIYLLVR